MAADANHLNGRGAQLIPLTFFKVESLVEPATWNWEFRIFPREQALERVWRIGAAIENDVVDTMHVTASYGGSSQVMGRFRAVHSGSVFEMRETIDMTEQEAYGGTPIMGLTASWEQENAYLTQLALYEVPRANLCLTRSVDDGVAPESFGVRSRIWADEDATPVLGPRGVASAVSSAIGNCRRAGLLYNIAPVRKNGVLNTTLGGVLSCTATRAYAWPVSASIQTRALYRSATTREIDVWVLVGSAVAGEKVVVDVVTESGAQLLISTTVAAANTPEWAHGRIAVRCDGISSTGLQEPTSGTERINYSAYTTGGNAGYVWAFCAGEGRRDF